MSPSTQYTGPLIFDAHTHLQESTIKESFKQIVERSKSVGVGGAVVCGCHEGDWDAVDEIKQKATVLDWKVFPQYGIHPWWVNTVCRKEEEVSTSTDLEDIAPTSQSSRRAAEISSSTPASAPTVHGSGLGWLDNLRARLVADPTAGIGEIGLDTYFEGLPPLTDQLHVCELQLLLARELKRPVTIHCLKAHTELLALLKKHKLNDIRIILHMFTGSVEYVKAYMKFSDYIYFSVFSKGPKKALIEAIPLNRLVVETDSPFQPAREEEVGKLMKGDHVCCVPPHLRNSDDNRKLLNDPSQLPMSLERICQAHNIEYHEAAQITSDNLFRALCLQQR